MKLPTLDFQFPHWQINSGNNCQDAITRRKSFLLNGDSQSLIRDECKNGLNRRAYLVMIKVVLSSWCKRVRARATGFIMSGTSLIGAYYQGNSLTRGGFERRWILHLRLDDISVVGYLGCKNVRVRNLRSIESHVGWSPETPRAAARDARDKRGVCTMLRDRYRDSRPVNGGLCTPRLLKKLHEFRYSY